jgi:nucleotide-binding universal stress UspA family protein
VEREKGNGVSEGEGRGTGPVVLCYDGSEVSRNAIAVAATVVQPGEAIVASIYELHVKDLLPGVDVNDRARQLAEEGSALANEVGFTATPVALGSGTIYRVLVEFAVQQRARVVVAGTSGRNSARAILGSVAYGIAHHCPRPVLLIRPSRGS